MACLESVFGAADDFAFEVCCEGGVVFSEAFDAKVAAEKGGGDVDVFYGDLDFVVLAVGLLGSDELGAGAQEGGCVAGEQL